MELELPISGSLNVGTAVDSEAPDHSLITEAWEDAVVSDYNASSEEDLGQQAAEADSEQVQDSPGYILQRLQQVAALTVGVTSTALFTVRFKDNGKDQGAALKIKTIAFNVFLTANIVGLLTSMLVAVILGTMQHTRKLVLFSKAVLCAAVGFAALASVTGAYVMTSPAEKWVPMAAVVATIAVVYLAFHYIY